MNALILLCAGLFVALLTFFRFHKLIRKLPGAKTTNAEGAKIKLAVAEMEKKLKRFETNRKAFLKLSEKGNQRNITISYFTEKDIQKRIIRYKMQLFVDTSPVGQPSLIKEDYFVDVNNDAANKVLDELAKPLLDAGLQVFVNKLPI